MKKFKYAVMGTHGVGKTTLATALRTALKIKNPGLRVSVAPELARICPFPLNENMTVASQQWIFNTQIKMELEYERITDILVCDRTIIDGLAYATYGGFFDFVRAHTRIAMDWFKSYDKVYWIRPQGHDIFKDDFRSTDADFQVAVDQYFKEMVEDFDLDVDQRLSMANMDRIPKMLLSSHTSPEALTGKVATGSFCREAGV